MTTHVMTEKTLSTEAETHSAPSTGRYAETRATGNGLNGGLPTEANHIMHAHVLSRATERLQAKYGASLDGDLVHRTVTDAYRELARTARLKTFLPTLAVNHAENRLRSLAATAQKRSPLAETMSAPLAA